MTVTEVAQMCRLQPVTIRAQIKRGAIKAEKHGRDWWIERDEAIRYSLERGGKRTRS